MSKELMESSGTKKLAKVLEMPSVKLQFENVLKDVAPSFIASLIEAVGSDKNLQECDHKSIIESSLKLACLKLPLNKSLGFGWIIPYKEKGMAIARAQIGYKGYIQLALRTGQYKYLNAGIVYEGEKIHLDKITGKVSIEGEPVSDKIMGFFGFFKTITGFEKYSFWYDRDMISHAEKYVRGYEKSLTWKNEYSKMGLKTCMSHLIRTYGPMSVEVLTNIAEIEDKEINYPSENDKDKVNDLTASESFDIEIEAETVVSNSENTEKVKPRSLDEIVQNGVNLDDEPEF